MTALWALWRCNEDETLHYATQNTIAPLGLAIASLHRLPRIACVYDMRDRLVGVLVRSLSFRDPARVAGQKLDQARPFRDAAVAIFRVSTPIDHSECFKMRMEMFLEQEQ